MQYFDLLEAFAQPGCAICRMVERDVARYLDSLLYEYVNKVPTHQAFRAGRGLCNPHSWQLQQVRRGAVLGIAILFNAALDEVQNITEQPSVSRFFGKSLADQLEPTGPCVACQKLTESEATYISIMTEKFSDARLEAAFRQSDGICLPHFQQLLREKKPNPLLIEIQQMHWAALQKQLVSLINKYKADYEGDPITQEEGESSKWALEMLAGKENIFGLRR